MRGHGLREEMLAPKGVLGGGGGGGVARRVANMFQASGLGTCLGELLQLTGINGGVRVSMDGFLT